MVRTMLTLESPKNKDIPKQEIGDQELTEEEGGRNLEDDKYIDSGQILRDALLSAKEDDSDSQEEGMSDDQLSNEDGSEITNDETMSDWDDLKGESALSYVTAVPAKEYMMMAELGTAEAHSLMGRKVLDDHSVREKSSKSRRRSKKHNKMVFLRKILPEPIIEIKEEEHAVVPTEVDDHMPMMEEMKFEDPAVDQQFVKDHQGNIDWLNSFRPLSLHHTDRGKPYLKCPACGAMFFTSNSFQTHLFSHMYKEDDRFACSFCNYTNDEPGMLFAHLSRHKDQCEFCNENLMRKNNFEKHWDIRAASFTMKRDHRGRFVCSLCQLVFDLLPQLEKHWLKHACKRERIYQCHECSGMYDSVETLKSHKCMKCPVCGKVYDSLHRLKAHTMWTKHNLKCPICSYEFILAMDHEKHLALHRQTYRTMDDHLHCLQADDGKTFQCNLCDKLFYALPPLVLHLQEDHSVEFVKREEEEDFLPDEEYAEGEEEEEPMNHQVMLPGHEDPASQF